MNLNEYAKDIHFTSTSKGFDTPNEENIHKKLLLTVSEICEAQEELRDGRKLVEVYWRNSGGDITELPYHAGASLDTFPKDKKPEGFPIEIADAIIRLLHIASAIGMDIDACVALKLAYNKTRPEKHGRKF